MRNAISKWVAAFAVVTASAGAAPAMACGFPSGGCSPCGQAYVSPCSTGYNAGYGYAGVAAYDRLPDPTPVTRQYYHVNQGPTFSGPGMFAPVPTYQETAIGWRGYDQGYGQDYGQGYGQGSGYGYRRGYSGGPYANPVNYSYTPAYRRPAIYSYQPRVQYRARPSYRYGYSMQPRVRYGYSQRGYTQRSYVSRGGYHQAQRYAAPRMMYAPRAAGPRAAAPQRGYHQQQRPQRYQH